MQESKHEKANDEQNKGTMENADEANLIIYEKVDNNKKEITGEENCEYEDGYNQEKEEEGEACTITTFRSR